MRETDTLDPMNPVPPPAEPSAAENPIEVDALKADLEATRAEATEWKDKFLRAKADVENIRRRAELDLSAAYKYAVERFAAEIIAVRDSLDLASTIELANSSEAIQKMYEGLDLTLKMLDGVFQKFGITLIDPKGEKFDPNRHQAISTVESTETPPNHVVNVVQKGYLLHDRVLRPAMVVVAREKKPTESAEQPTPDA
jgi:molecular chaperone GrpE